MNAFEELLEGLKRLEGRIFPYVLSSFAFSLLAVVLEYGNFENSFLVVTELVGGIVGATAILATFLGSLGHVTEERYNMLAFQPKIVSLRYIWLMLSSLPFLLGFYFLAVQSNYFCLLFLCIGMYLLYSGLSGVVLVMQLSEKQKQMWNSLTKEEQGQWLQTQQEIQRILDEVEESSRQSEQTMREVDATLREHRQAVRRRQFETIQDKLVKFLTYPWRISLGIRERLGEPFLTFHEKMQKLQIQEQMKELYERMHNKNSEKIISGEFVGYLVEGTSIRIYQVVAWKYIVLPDVVSLQLAEQIVQIVQGLTTTEGKKRPNVVAIFLPSSQISFQASQTLEQSGIILHCYRG